jgi:hypothetical protein
MVAGMLSASASREQVLGEKSREMEVPNGIKAAPISVQLIRVSGNRVCLGLASSRVWAIDR